MSSFSTRRPETQYSVEICSRSVLFDSVSHHYPDCYFCLRLCASHWVYFWVQSQRKKNGYIQTWIWECYMCVYVGVSVRKASFRINWIVLHTVVIQSSVFLYFCWINGGMLLSWDFSLYQSTDWNVSKTFWSIFTTFWKDICGDYEAFGKPLTFSFILAIMN